MKEIKGEIMLNIAICDDDLFIVKQTKNFILNSKSNYEEINIFTYNSSEDILKAVDEKIQFDIVFMDLMFGDKAIGMTTAVLLKFNLPDCLIIYMSFYEDYYSELVRRELFRFLEKPLTQSIVDEVLRDAYERINHCSKKYSITFKGTKTIIRVSKILYVESFARKCNIYMHGGEIYTFYKKLDDLEWELNVLYPYFARPSKSYLINLHYMKKWGLHSIVMEDKKELSIMIGYRNNFMNKVHKLYH